MSLFTSLTVKPCALRSAEKTTAKLTERWWPRAQPIATLSPALSVGSHVFNIASCHFFAAAVAMTRLRTEAMSPFSFCEKLPALMLRTSATNLQSLGGPANE